MVSKKEIKAELEKLGEAIEKNTCPKLTETLKICYDTLAWVLDRQSLAPSGLIEMI